MSLRELPIAMPGRTRVKITFQPGVRPKVDLGGTPEINLRGFFERYIEMAMNREHEIFIKAFGPQWVMIRNEKTGEMERRHAPLATKRDAPEKVKKKDAWEIVFDGGDTVAKQTKIPMHALVSFALRWAHGYDEKTAKTAS